MNNYEYALHPFAKTLWLTHYSGHDSAEAMLSDARSAGFDGALHVAGDGDSIAW